MKYTTRLPAIHLGGETLAALEDALSAGCTSPEFDVELKHGSVTYRCSSLREIREDTTLPPVVRSFEVSLTSREGHIELVADKREEEFSLELSGEQSWVEAKRRSLESFFRTHGATVRTFLERYMAFCLSFLAMAGCLLFYYAGLGGVIGMRTPIDSLLFGSVALIAGGVLHLLLNVVYPYVLLVTADGSNTEPIYLNR